MSKEKPKKEERRDPWAEFLQTVTPQTKARLIAAAKVVRPLDTPPPETLRGEDHDDYASFYASLSPVAAEQVGGMTAKAVDAEPPPEVTEARYGIVECPDGEWAQIKLFKTVEGLANRFSNLEGLDVVAWVFYGVPLQFTKGPQRYLRLPDGRHAVKLPTYGNGPHEIVDVIEMENIDPQEDGFLGPPQLTEGMLPDIPPVVKAKPGDWKDITGEMKGKGKGKDKKRPVDDEEEDRRDDEDGEDEDPAAP